MGALLILSVFSFGQDEELKKLQLEQSTAMEHINFLVGSWQAVSYTNAENGGWELAKDQSITGPTSFKLEMAGKMMAVHLPGPINFMGAFTYDVFNHEYRAAFVDDALGLLDTYTGNIEKGTLTISNIKSNTYYGTEDKKVHTRIRIIPSKPTGFSMIIHGSDDKGKTWEPMGKFVFTNNQQATN